MAVTESGIFLLLLLLYFPTPILMSIREICQGWILTTEDDYFYTHGREVLGKYLRVKDSNETSHQTYHREEFKNEGGYTLWYDTTPQWAIYKSIFTDEPPMTPGLNGTDIVNQQDRVIQTGCEEEVLDECKAFNYTYHHPRDGDVEDSSMSLICIDFGSGTQEGNSLMSIVEGWLIVIVVLMCAIIVSVMLMVIVAVFFPKRTNLGKGNPNKNTSYTPLNRNETTEMDDLQHQQLEKRYVEATRMFTDVSRQALTLASQVRQIDVEVGLLQKTVHHVGNTTQVFKAQPIKSCEESIGDGINAKGTEAITVCTT